MMETTNRTGRTARMLVGLALVLLAGCSSGSHHSQAGAGTTGHVSTSGQPGSTDQVSTSSQLGAAGNVTLAGTVVRPFDKASYQSPDNAPTAAEVSAAGGQSAFLAAHACEPRFSTNFADLVPAAPVQVKNDQGDPIGNGTLSAATYDATNSKCVFHFSVGQLPSISSYVVAVAQRPDASFSSEQIKSGVTITFST